MSYTAQARIESAIPAQLLNEALDDDGDGMADAEVLVEVLASADQAVDAFLAGLFVVPFVATETVLIPATVCEAAFIFACERVYDRRQVDDKNPWRSRANSMRERLEKIGEGKLPLDAASSKSFTPGALVSEPSVIDGRMG